MPNWNGSLLFCRLFCESVAGLRTGSIEAGTPYASSGAAGGVVVLG